jgi:hypothetical protein
MPQRNQPSVAIPQISAKRLLILDDRRKDVELLLTHRPITENFQVGGSKMNPIYLRDIATLDREEANVKKAQVVVAETLLVGLEVIKRQRFDFIISDLLLFNPEQVNAPTTRKKSKKNKLTPGTLDFEDITAFAEPDYFGGLPLEDQDQWGGRRTQIVRPHGLRFIRELRIGERGQNGTRRDVPIIAMTFFWRHPRFDALYLKQIKEIDGAPVGYLPKYYWVGNKRIQDKGDDALRVLIQTLDTQLDNYDLNRRLVPMVFDAVALDLFVYKNRFDLHDALGALRESYHTSCRSMLDFKLHFKMRNIPEPRDSPDPFIDIMERLNEVDVREINISVKFENVPRATERAGIIKERKLDSHEQEWLTLKGQTDKRNIRKFGICLALALYTYPLAYDPHCLNTNELAQLLTKGLKEKVNERTVIAEINSIRDDLQAKLPAEVKDFVSTKNHLIVSHGKTGYYLNGSYHIDWAL